MREQVKEIIIEEFQNLINLIQNDFKNNFDKKVNNFLLSEMDEKVTASMVFVSSFESKSGFAIETCAKKIAKLRYGDDKVPSIVNPNKISHNFEFNDNKQYVITKVDINNSDLDAEITKFRSTNEAKGSGKNRQESNVTQNSISKKLIPLKNKFESDEVHAKPVDLAFFDGKEWNIMELKAGGNLDSSNARANVEKLLKIYTCLGDRDAKVYFATLYNKNGEGNTWTGAVKKHLNFPEMFLIGSKFWEKILPENLTFEDFIQIYKEALNEIDINDKVNNLMNSVI